MDTLPVCEVRKISYSTFTIIDVDADGATRVIEHGNPELALVRNGREILIERSPIKLERWKRSHPELLGVRDGDGRSADRLLGWRDAVGIRSVGHARWAGVGRR